MFDFLYWLSVSYVPSYLVYLFVVYLPRRKDQRALSVFVANQTAMIGGDGQAILNELSKAAGHSVEGTPTIEDFKIICSQINPSGNAPILKRIQPLEHGTWIDYLLDRKARSERAVDLLLRYVLYLESEHVRLITEIRGCVLFMVLDGMAGQSLSNSDMSFLATALYRHNTLTRELSNYADKHMKGLAWSKRRL